MGATTLETAKITPKGLLHGNASGPAIWTILSSVIFEILHKRGFATKHCTVIYKQLFHLVGFAYVDDCDLVQSGTDPIAVLESMHTLINSWGSLMQVTGGVLNVEKVGSIWLTTYGQEGNG